MKKGENKTPSNPAIKLKAGVWEQKKQNLKKEQLVFVKFILFEIRFVLLFCLNLIYVTFTKNIKLQKIVLSLKFLYIMFDWLINFHFKKIMSLPKINEITWNQLVIIIIIACLCRSDCPISYYPEATFIGSIQANIDSSTARVKQQQFAYNLVQPLTSSSPKVAIMINGLSYRSQGSINFNIFYKPTPSFSQLIFLVNVTQTGKNKWQWVRFSFFASQNKIFQLGQQTVNSFTNTQIDNKKLIASKLPLDNNYEKPVLKIFLNGLSVNSTVTKEEVTQIRTQIQGYRSLTWSASVVKYLEKRLVEREILQALLYNMVLENRTLSFFVELGYKQVMEFISFSYVIFTNDQTVYHNEFIQSRFTQNFDTMINAPALQHMDLFIIGIQGLKFKQWEFLSMNPSLQIFKDNQTFSIKDVFTSQSNSFNLSYFALSKTKDSYCSHCRDGNIVYENFCVSECPESYVKKYNQIGQYCELCDIKQFKVPNALKTQCQCAMQYFSIAVKNTSQFTCSACNYQCLTCQSEYKCLTCDTNYLNTFRVLNQTSNQCVCSSGYYDDGSNNIKCLKCHHSCLTCRGPSQFDCETCPKGKTRGIDGNCICEGNFIEKNGICVCESPNFNYKGYCFTFLSKNKCTENQVSITLSDGSSKCQCKSGFQIFKTICVPCGQNQRVDQQTGKCVCKQNFYKDEEKNTCVACTQGKLYNDELKKCVCMKGSFQTSDGRCVTCRRRQTLINNECQCIFNYFKNDWGQCQRCQANSTRPECMPNYR